MRARLAEGYRNGGEPPASIAAPVEMELPGQTALFNAFEDAQECAKCGGRMVRTGSCYTPFRHFPRCHMTRCVAGV